MDSAIIYSFNVTVLSVKESLSDVIVETIILKSKHFKVTSIQRN